MLGADPSKVSPRAKKRGLPQMGTLGAGNHYAEIQVCWWGGGVVQWGVQWGAVECSGVQWGRLLLTTPASPPSRSSLPTTSLDGCPPHTPPWLPLLLPTRVHIAHTPQVVDEVFDSVAARKMGIDRVGQVCIMIHSGSRGLGHQVATDALVAMERAMARDGIHTNDRQLACARISSQVGAAGRAWRGVVGWWDGCGWGARRLGRAKCACWGG